MAQVFLSQSISVVEKRSVVACVQPGYSVADQMRIIFGPQVNTALYRVIPALSSTNYSAMRLTTVTDESFLSVFDNF